MLGKRPSALQGDAGDRALLRFPGAGSGSGSNQHHAGMSSSHQHRSRPPTPAPPAHLPGGTASIDAEHACSAYSTHGSYVDADSHQWLQESVFVPYQGWAGDALAATACSGGSHDQLWTIAHPLSARTTHVSANLFYEHDQVFVILFGVGEREVEGIYSLREEREDGELQETIMAFECQDDAQRYAGLLEATMLSAMEHTPTVCAMTQEELLAFCDEVGYHCRLEPLGSLTLPPDLNVPLTDWERSVRLRAGHFAVLEGEAHTAASGAGAGGAAACEAAARQLVGDAELAEVRARLEALVAEPSADDAAAAAASAAAAAAVDRAGQPPQPLARLLPGGGSLPGCAPRLHAAASLRTAAGEAATPADAAAAAAATGRPVWCADGHGGGTIHLPDGRVFLGTAPPQQQADGGAGGLPPLPPSASLKEVMMQRYSWRDADVDTLPPGGCPSWD